MNKTALVVGATGLIGRCCVQQLLADAYYQQVMVLVRRPLPMQHPKLVQHIVDFEQMMDHFPDITPDDVFCCLGTTIKTAGSTSAFRRVDFDYPLRIAKQCLRQGASGFLVVSAMGASPTSSLFYNRVKGDLASGLMKLGYTSLHIFRPSLLWGARSEKRLLESLGKLCLRALSFLLIGPLRPYRAIQANAVAAAMLQAAKQGNTGLLIYPSQQIQALSKLV